MSLKNNKHKKYHTHIFITLFALGVFLALVYLYPVITNASSFKWVTSSWGSCVNNTYQTRSLQCMQTVNGKIVSNYYCSNLVKPETINWCGTGPRYVWNFDSIYTNGEKWSDCIKNLQTRGPVYCSDKLPTMISGGVLNTYGSYQTVPDNFCKGPKPITSQYCADTATWFTTQWSKCYKNQQSRSYECRGAVSKKLVNAYNCSGLVRPSTVQYCKY